jgi:hypothetical protein
MSLLNSSRDADRIDNSKKTQRHSAWLVPFTHRRRKAMSLLSRRSIVSRFFASVPAIAVAAAAPVSALAKPKEEPGPPTQPAEAEELTVLFDKSDAAVAELKAADEVRVAAEKRFFELLPPVPKELIIRRGRDDGMSGRPTDLIMVGRGWNQIEIRTPEYFHPERPTPWRAFAEQIRSLKRDYPARSPWGRRARRLLPIAERYERQVSVAARKAKIVAAYLRYSRAFDEACYLTQKAIWTEPQTWAGLARKAVAVSAADQIGDDTVKSHIKRLGGERLSADILRLAGEKAAA